MGSEELERLHQEIESLRAEVRQLRESTAKFVNGSVARDSKAQPEESRPGKGLAGELEEIEHEPERFKSFIREHPYYVAILLVIACAVAGGIYAAWRYLESYEVTSDARVVGDISPISSQVPGTVTKVLVNNDQRVQAGQPLVQLDASEYKLLVDRSRAMRDGARGRRSCPFAEQGGPGRNSLPLMATSPVMRWTRRGTWRQPHGRRWMRRLPRNTPLTPLSAGAVKVERHHRQRAGCGDSRGANRKCRRASAALPAGARHCPDRKSQDRSQFQRDPA
jgi:biotin/lipoyl-binding protein